MTLDSIQASQVLDIKDQGTGAWWDKDWQSGIFKTKLSGIQKLSSSGLATDAQANLEVHGGPDKAISCYSSEYYPDWLAFIQKENPTVKNLEHGAFGENFTTMGMLEDKIFLGDIFRIGSALVQVTQPRQPCWKLAFRWRVKRLTKAIERSAKSGFYLRVLKEGEVQARDSFELIETGLSQYSIKACHKILFGKDPEAMLLLSQEAALAKAWLNDLQEKADHIQGL